MYKKILQIFGTDTRPLQYHVFFMSLVASVMGTLVVMIIKDSPEHLEGGVFHPMYILGFILILVTFAVSRQSGLMGGVKLSEKIMERTRLKIANQIRQAGLPHVENLDMAEIYVVMSRGSRSNQNGARAAVHTLQSAFIILFCIGYLLLYSPVAAMGCILCISLVLAIYEFYYRHVLYREMYETYEMERQLFNSMNHFFEGFKELKLNASKSADLYENHLAPAVFDTEDLRIKIERRFADNSILCNAIFFLLLAGVIFVQARFESPDRILQIATIIIFLWTPLQTLNLSMPHIAEAFVAIDRNIQLERTLNFKDDIGQTVHDSSRETLKSFKSIDLEGVCFSHSDKDGNRDFSIGPIDLSVRAGEILFIMGGNGSGKSTLIKVLCGLYPPEEGQFFIDGLSVDITDHRYLFSAVFSDFHLFEKLYGVDDVDETKVKALLDLMELSRSTQWRGDRFTKLDLSTGQKKRLALIGTLLEDKPVLLFDEWAAEQAPHFRKYFYETLLPDFKAAGKAVVVITHDDRFSSAADRVIKLERGRPVTVLKNNPADTEAPSCPQ